MAILTDKLRYGAPGVVIRTVYSSARDVGLHVVLALALLVLLSVASCRQASAQRSVNAPTNNRIGKPLGKRPGTRVSDRLRRSMGTLGPCGRQYDTRVRHPYAIHATWMFGRDSACAWQDTLEQFHSLGGQVILSFGSVLTPLSGSASARPDSPRLDDCGTADDGTKTRGSCVAQAKRDLAARGIATRRVANWLIYETDEPHGDAFMCPGRDSLDKKFTVTRGGSSQTIWRLVLNHDDHRAACQYDQGRVDVVFVVQSQVAPNQNALFTVADALGMEVYLGAPAFSTKRGGWLPDYDMAEAMLDLSARMFRDFARRNGAHPSFAGVYQSFEVSLMPAWHNDGYDLYTRQANLLDQYLPGKRYAVSPYLFVNKQQQGTDIRGTVDGFQRLARTGADVIMPQDGRGTGKSALYWPWQRHRRVADVDPQLANFTNVKGNASFAANFNASTNELFAALRAARERLATEEGLDVHLWPNVEAFDEDRDDADYVGCEYSDLSQTSKERVDRAIAFAGPATRVVSFMYDPLFTCRERYGVSLIEAIVADYDRPIVVAATMDDNPARGVTLTGYHLQAAGTRFRVSWTDGSGRVQTALARIADTPSGMWPTLDTVRLTLDRMPTLEAGTHVDITAVTADGRRSRMPYSVSTP